MIMVRFLLITMLQASVLTLAAQRMDISKMSPTIRTMVRATESHSTRQAGVSPHRHPVVTAFVRTTADAGFFDRMGCRSLRQWGDIHAVSIPQDRIAGLSLRPEVLRIEAGRSCTALVDTTMALIGVDRVHEGETLPQAFTGRGVVVGVQDIGFDLTHPTLYDPTTTQYRVKCFWDQLSLDTVGSSMTVGRDYREEAEILGLKHSRDGLTQTHGTHTSGIAAGGGFKGKYRGVAYESDICLVNNLVTDNMELVDSIDRYRYTTATDALGFQYCFDYADQVGKPCVVSFSEGSPQDLYGEDMLYHEVLERMTGPGHIFVAAAGNRGESATYFSKPYGEVSEGTFLTSYRNHVHAQFRAVGDFDFRLTFYHPSGTRHRITVPSESIFYMPDSLLEDSLMVGAQKYRIIMAAYPSCYNPDSENAFEVYVEGPGGIGKNTAISLEVVGQEAEAEFFLLSGNMGANALNPQLTAGEHRYSIHSPGAAAAAVCVGADTYRVGAYYYLGKWKEYYKDGGGQIAPYSSIGPTLTGITKPDIVAPGTNIVSAYNSYYIENNPEASDVLWDVEHFDYDGRTYAWNCNTGTSMSTPFVAGIIALWLEACPELTPADIRRIFSETSRRRDTEVPSNLWGYGEIDAYAGLVAVLQIAADIPVSLSHPSAIRLLSVKGSVVTLEASETKSSPLDISIYSVKGELVSRKVYYPGNQQVVIPVEAPSGVYAIQVNSPDKKLTGSFLVRTTKN